MANGRIGYYPVWFRPEKDERGSWNVHHEDGTLIATMPEGATFFDETCFPFKDGYPEGRAAMDEALDEAMDKVLWQKLVHSPWDHVGEEDFWDRLRRGRWNCGTRPTRLSWLFSGATCLSGELFSTDG